MKNYTLHPHKWNGKQRTRMSAADELLNHRMKGMTNLVRFAVCDSDRETVDCIINELRTCFQSKCDIMAYSDGSSLLSDHRQERFDTIFLGISASGLNGMEIAEKIRANDKRVIIVFVSDQTDLAYKGYIYDAFRFVRKSNLDQDLHEAALSLNQALLFQNEQLELKTENGDISIVVKSIKYFEADGHFINMTCTEGTVRTYGTMQDYEERLKNIGFIRIHKSFLVNFRYIVSMNSKTVTLTCGTRLPLSRNRIDNTKTKIRLFQEN